MELKGGIFFLFAAALLCPACGVSLHDLVKRDTKVHWDYDKKGTTGPSNWKNQYTKCGGSRQSPVDIDSDGADPNPQLSDFEFDNYDDNLEGATIKNNGHTVQVSPSASDPARTFKAGGLDDEYKFLQLHFHWGSTSKRGSEHTIDGKQYPLEMHIVSTNTNYKTIDKALGKEDGLAVLGVLFKLSDEDNEDLKPIIDKLDDIRKKDAEADLDDFKLEDLLPDDLTPYYRYKGSLTTPSCNEVVIWTVFDEFVPISESQLQQFRNVKEGDEDNLVDNFRPVQPLHDRIVEVSADHNSATTAVSSVAVILLGLLILA